MAGSFWSFFFRTMDKSAWRKLREIVPEAVALADRERRRFLDEACGGDSSLRHEAERMIEAFEAAEAAEAVKSPLGGLLDDVARMAAPDELPRHNEIGPWSVKRRIGSGGMGVVYAAARSDGRFDREVAIKVLQPGLYPEERHRRFDFEQRVLAKLQHENIARLYDGGITPSGEPFLVMEYIDGTPITEFCVAGGLSLRERVKLFRSVCDAVQYAHQNLVVHRDIKPSNILITADGKVKLLDFGIAKLLDADADADADVDADLAATGTAVGRGRPDLRPLTRTGHVLMTPEYAAPEQVRGDTINAATDVYSLGVVLFELLVGKRPYVFESRTASAIERAVCEIEPPKPSTAARRASQERVVGAARETASLSQADVRRLRGDLDTIVLKALRKNSQRRYPSALQFGDDLQRYLEGLPVSARPDSAGYRTRKFVRRHWVGVSSAFALLAVLVAGLVGTTWQARVAKAEARKADAAKNFLQEMLASADPYGEGSRDVTIVEALDSAAARIDAELGTTPDVAADVRLTLGTSYLGLGKYPAAEEQLLRAVEEHVREYGALAVETGVAYRTLGNLYIQISRLAEADSILEIAARIHGRNAGNQGRALAQTLGALGGSKLQTGQYEDAEFALRRALLIVDALPKPLQRDEAQSRDNYRYTLGILLHDLGRFTEADSALSLAISAIRERGRPLAPFLGGALQMHAWVKDYVGESSLTEPLLTEALAFRVARFGEDHIEVGYTLNDLAYLYHANGDSEKADSMYLQALGVFRTAVGDEERIVGTILNNRASLYRDTGRAVEAIPMLEEAAALNRRLLGDRHVDVSYPINNLGHTYRVLGRLEKAAEYYREALAIRREALPPGHTDIGGPVLSLGRVLMEGGRLDEAEPLLTEAVGIQSAALGPDHRDTAEAEYELARLLLLQNRGDDARRLLEHAYPILTQAYGEGHEQSLAAARLLDGVRD